jgi:hypothetical protein
MRIWLRWIGGCGGAPSVMARQRTFLWVRGRKASLFVGACPEIENIDFYCIYDKQYPPGRICLTVETVVLHSSP